jgi:transposase
MIPYKFRYNFCYVITNQLIFILTDKERILQLEVENTQLRQQVNLLLEKVTYLMEIIQKNGMLKDSHNSSLPPSSDFFTRNKSLRTVSERKSGGQLGHEGTTLKLSENPNNVIELKSNFCSKCGQILPENNFILKAKRQVVEIPPILPIYNEYRQYVCRCSACNHEQIADFPAHVNAPIQYGSSVEAVVSYLSVYQYVPFARLQKMLTHTFSLPISQGSVNNILERVAQKCTGMYDEIKNKISKSSVVGADETGVKINGVKCWIWSWQSTLETFIVASDNRGSKTVERIWKDGLPNATVVSDRWAAHLKMLSKDKQLCLAHLLRDLNFLIETEKDQFSVRLKSFLNTIFHLKEKQRAGQKAVEKESEEANIFEKELNEILAMTIENNNRFKTNTFQKAIIKYRNHILPCIYDSDIPPDNNASERAIRTIKVKQKVSGQFKTGQNAFCIIRSVIDTLIKRKFEVFPTLNQIVSLDPV